MLVIRLISRITIVKLIIEQKTPEIREIIVQYAILNLQRQKLLK